MRERSIVLKSSGFVIHRLLRPFKQRFHKEKGLKYGLLDALFFPRDIDVWTRYADILREIRETHSENNRIRSILEVGSGPGAILEFLEKPKFTLTLLDISKKVFAGKKDDVNMVVADGCLLPFKDHAFDATIAVDTLEHVPEKLRHDFLKELKRSCKKILLLHFPMQSSNGLFKGRTYDIEFQNVHNRIFKSEDLKTAEHIRRQHPTLKQVRDEFPNAKIVGRQNCDVWLKYMTLSRRAVVGFSTGIIYFLFWKRRDNMPPYWGCMISLDMAKNHE